MSLATAIVLGYFAAATIFTIVALTGTHPFREIRDLFCLWRKGSDCEMHAPLYSRRRRFVLAVTRPWDCVVIWNDQRRQRARKYRAKLAEDKAAMRNWRWLDAFYAEHEAYVAANRPFSVKIGANIAKFMESMRKSIEELARISRTPLWYIEQPRSFSQELVDQQHEFDALLAARAERYREPYARLLSRATAMTWGEPTPITERLRIEAYEHGPLATWGPKPKPLVGPSYGLPFNLPTPFATDYREKGVNPKNVVVGVDPARDADPTIFYGLATGPDGNPGYLRFLSGLPAMPERPTIFDDMAMNEFHSRAIADLWNRLDALDPHVTYGGGRPATDYAKIEDEKFIKLGEMAGLVAEEMVDPDACERDGCPEHSGVPASTRAIEGSFFIAPLDTPVPFDDGNGGMTY